MKVNFQEVDSLKKGLRKIRQKNRYLLSRKEKKWLEKAVDLLDSLEDLKMDRKHSLKRSVERLFRTLLKLFV